MKNDAVEQSGKNFKLHCDTLVSDVRDHLLTKRRAQTFLSPWNKMSQEDQQDEIEGITNLAEQIIRKCVDIVADNGFETIYATLDDVALKTGTAKLKIANLDDPTVLCAMGAHIGKSVRIVVADDSDFDKARTQMQADLDQPPLPMGGDGEQEPGESIDPSAGEDAKTTYDANVEFPDTDELDTSGNGDAEAGTPIDAEGKPLTPKAEGYVAGVSGKDKPENPFIEGEPNAKEWEAGYQDGVKEASKIMKEGATAFADGVDADAAPYKAGTDARMFWMRGFDQEEAKASKAEQAEFDKEVDASAEGKAKPKGTSKKK